MAKTLSGTIAAAGHFSRKTAALVRAGLERTLVLLRRLFTLTDTRVHQLVLAPRIRTLLPEPLRSRLPAWDPKRTGEAASFAFDLQLWLATGETLTGTPTAVATVASDSKVADSPVALSVDDIALDGTTKVAVSLSGGRDGAKYVVTASVGTSAGQTLQPAATLLVADLAL